MAPIFGDIERLSVDGIYEFGKNGKPCYFAGPHDDPASQHLILNSLESTAGPGNYYFVTEGALGRLVELDELPDDFETEPRKHTLSLD